MIVEETGEVHYPGSSDRVAWTATVGLPDIEPTLMVRVMQGVTADAKVLKERAGVSARGRRLATPYGHMSLNWGPDENPTKKEMLGAAREALSAVGIKANHYALIVAHTDTDHPHVHVVFSRIDPNTGKAAKLSYSGMRLSSWAERWERKHGGIRIENRVARREVREHNKRVIEEAQRAGRDVDPAELKEMPPMAPPRTRDPHGNSVQRTPAERQDWTSLCARHRVDNTPTAQRKTDRLELAMSLLEKRTTKLENETAVHPVVEPPRPRPMAVRPAVPEPELVTVEQELAPPPPAVMPSRPAVPEPELVTVEQELAPPPPAVMPSRPAVPEPELVTVE
ncbi:MAG: relaxase/mobilization nuclease domain-containing protein, partial [Acidobacteria bacterium]|nr:relaxase/mobilization nuclease domain-containing protein [Acidobacteriota bacterium]